MLKGVHGLISQGMPSRVSSSLSFKSVNCRDLAEEMISSVRDTINRLCSQSPPRLDVIRTSNRDDSDAYIRRKQKVLESVGIKVLVHDASGYNGECLRGLIHDLNGDDRVKAVLVQFPMSHDLQKSVSEDEIMELVDWRKDVDGFHPQNLIRSLKSHVDPNGDFYYESCTAAGIMELFRAMELNLSGLDVALIGKSRVVGLPLLHRLLASGATVQCCHRTSHQLAEKTVRADVIIVAAGQFKLVQEHWVKPGAIIIDVGINHDPQNGRLLGGDVDFEGVKSKAAFVTPVPGGVGPLTIAALARNVLKAAQRPHLSE